MKAKENPPRFDNAQLAVDQTICKLDTCDLESILKVVNDAAEVYKNKIPTDCWKEPYMPAEELKKEVASGVQFYGYKEKGMLNAVMGIQQVGDVTLIRHAYVASSSQRRGIGEKLLEHLLSLVQTNKVYVGTWEAAIWAVKFYKKNGFELVSYQEKNKYLHKYWCISERQVESSVVLELKR